MSVVITGVDISIFVDGDAEEFAEASDLVGTQKGIFGRFAAFLKGKDRVDAGDVDSAVLGIDGDLTFAAAAAKRDAGDLVSGDVRGSAGEVERRAIFAEAVDDPGANISDVDVVGMLIDGDGGRLGERGFGGAVGTEGRDEGVGLDGHGRGSGDREGGSHGNYQGDREASE